MLNTSGLFTLDPEMLRCPHEAYRQLREERPVYYEPAVESYVVTRYDDVTGVLRDPDTFSSEGLVGPEYHRLLAGMASVLSPEQLSYLRMPMQMAGADGEPHRRVRKLALQALTPRVVHGLVPRIEQVSRRFVDACAGGEPVEFTTTFSKPYVRRVLAEALGVPDSDDSKFKEWTDSILVLISGEQLSEAALADYFRCGAEFVDYFRERVERLRGNPDGSVTSMIVQAQEGGDRLTTEEAIGLHFSLVAAGTESTQHVISEAMLTLAQQPDLADKIRADPEEKVPAFVNEVIRLVSPTQGFYRNATRDTEIAGVPIRAGESVLLRYGSANRDGTTFVDPDEIRLDRAPTPRHIAFGYGPHQCLGALLARTEARIAVAGLLDRFGSIELAQPAESIHYKRHLIVRGVAELWLRFR
jgi:cytochrome P450